MTISPAPSQERMRRDPQEISRSFGISAEDYMLPAQEQIQIVAPDGSLAAPGDRQAGHEYPLPPGNSC